MRVCLINPPNLVPKEIGFSGIFQPIGLAYIAAVLEKNGYEVFTLDALAEGWNRFTKLNDSMRLLGLTYDDIASYIRKISPDIVGISAIFSVQAQSAYRCASVIKEVDKNIITVLGGIHSTIRPLECLAYPDVDIVVRGEGEFTMLNLVKVFERGKIDQLNKIRGIG